MKTNTQNSKAIRRDIVLRKLGRVPTLTKNNIKSMVEYFENYSDSYEVPVEIQKKSGETHTEMKSVPQGLPTLAKLADYMGVKRTNIYNWYEHNSDFSELYDKLKNKFEEELIANNALLGKFNSNFSKFYLINKHGYQDRIEVGNDKTAKAPVQFNTQINYFLDQQGVKPLEDNQEVKKDELPAFRSE